MSRPTIEEAHLRRCMLLLFDRGMKANEAVNKITDTYGDVLKLNKCHRWFKKFKNGNRNLKDAARKGRPQKLDDDILKAMVDSDPRQTIEELSLKIGCPWSTVQDHLRRIGKLYRQGIWVPRELTETALDQRRTICASLLFRYEVDPFLRRIVTEDEKWMLYNNPVRKRQWFSSGETPVPTPRPSLTIKKVLVCMWWDFSGIIH
ncbi:Histone-lysine N-methyltransferase SETMAR, partial [Anthophora quadrimaculata]